MYDVGYASCLQWSIYFHIATWHNIAQWSWTEALGSDGPGFQSQLCQWLATCSCNQLPSLPVNFLFPISKMLIPSDIVVRVEVGRPCGHFAQCPTQLLLAATSMPVSGWKGSGPPISEKETSNESQEVAQLSHFPLLLPHYKVLHLCVFCSSSRFPDLMSLGKCQNCTWKTWGFYRSI